MTQQLELPDTRPVQHRYYRRECHDTYNAILRLRRAGFAVFRTQIKGIHAVDGVHYDGFQMRQLAEALKDE